MDNRVGIDYGSRGSGVDGQGRREQQGKTETTVLNNNKKMVIFRLSN